MALVSPDPISTFFNIYRHTSPLLTLYLLISSSTNLYWSSTSQYRHILTQYHQVPLIINHPERHSSVNLKNSHFTTHLMSHAQYTWSSFLKLAFTFWWRTLLVWNFNPNDFKILNALQEKYSSTMKNAMQWSRIMSSQVCQRLYVSKKRILDPEVDSLVNPHEVEDP